MRFVQINSLKCKIKPPRATSHPGFCTKIIKAQKVTFGAYRICGILPGEEMELPISITSVIISFYHPERQTNVRECGARVTHIVQVPLIVRILCNFSALPQYLGRKRSRYANPLRHIMPSNLHVSYRRKWVRFCAEHKKIDRHPLWSAYLFFLVSRSISKSRI